MMSYESACPMLFAAGEAFGTQHVMQGRVPVARIALGQLLQAGAKLGIVAALMRLPHRHP